MPKVKISEFSSTPANNTDIDSINISEGCAPSGINDAIRELMAQLKDFQTGAVGDSFNGPVGTTTAAAGAFTTLSSTGNTTLGDASGDSVTINGTATFANANPTLSAGTANGVAYLNGSKVVTSGSALTFDGSSLGVGVASPTQLIDGTATNPRLKLTATSTGYAASQFANSSGSSYFGRDNSAGGFFGIANGTVVYSSTNDPIGFFLGTNEQMRLTSTGLGIGTSSPVSKLTVLGAGTINAPETTTTGGSIQTASYGITTRTGNLELGATDSLAANIGGSLTFSARYSGTNATWVTGKVGAYRDTATSGVASSYLAFATTTGAGDLTERMRLDASGNLGLGTASSFGKLTINSNGAPASSGSMSTGLTVTNGSTGTAINIGTFDAGSYNYIQSAYVNNANTARALAFFLGNSQAMTLDASGNLGVGTTSITGGYKAQINGNLLLGTAANPLLVGTTSLNFLGDNTSSSGMRLDSSGNLLVGKTSTTFSTVGVSLYALGNGQFTASANEVVDINRLVNDGILVRFFQDSTEEGNISVSGTTVSYNGGHLSRSAQTTTAKDESLVKGTVLSNLDEMNVYTKDGQPVDNEQLNKVKVSDVEGDANVAGVFVNWTHDDAHNVDEINMAMTGDMIIRIAQGTTVARGDLLMSAGDGTAKPQGDDIVRSKTIAKVTSNHVTCTYADGSYCVPCVLMAC